MSFFLRTRSRLIAQGLVVLCAVAGVPGGTMAADSKLPKHAVLRLGANPFSHGRYVTELSLVPESSQIVTIGGDHEVRVWDMTGVLTRSIPRQRNLTNTSFSMDGRWRLGTARVSDPMQPGVVQYFHLATSLVTEKEIRLGPVPSPAYSMSITADGKLLAMGVPGAALGLVDTDNVQTLASKVLPGPNNVAAYPRTFLTPDGALLLAEQPGGDWHIFDLKDRNLAHPLESLGKFSNAKPVFSSRKGVGAMIGWDGRIVIRDFFQGRNLVEFRHGRVTALDGAFSPDDKTLATCGADGFVRLWEVGNGRLIREINTEERHPNAVAFLANGETLVSAGGQGRVRFWDVATGVEQPQRDAASGCGAIKCVAISPDGRTAALAGDLGEICLWDLASGKRLGELPDRDLTGGPFDPWIGHRFLAFAPDDKTLVAGSSDRHNSVNLWDVATRRRVARFAGHHWPITCVACSPNGKLIVSGSRDRSVLAWDTSGRQIWQATGNGAQILTLAFSPDGTRVYSAGHTNKIDVWRADDGTREQFDVSGRPRPEPLNVISALAVSRDGRYVATVLGESTAGHQVVVAEIASRRTVCNIGGQGDWFQVPEAETCFCVAFHPQLDVLAVGAGDGTVAIHRMPSGEVIEKLHGHTSIATSVTWSVDGNGLLSGSSDGTAFLWDTTFLQSFRRGESDRE